MPDPPDARVSALPVAFSDDAALVDAVRRRHPAAARALWDRFSPVMGRVLRRVLAPADVDDALQIAMLRAWDKLPDIREPDRLRSFVVGITMRVARETLRRQRVRRFLRLTSDGQLPETAAASHDHAAAEALARLDAVLQRLDGDTRLLFALRYVEEIPTAELASAIGCSLATAKRRVKRARERVEAAARRDPALMDYVSGLDSGDVGDDHDKGARHG